MEKEKLIDFESLAVFSGNDKDLMKLLINTFLEYAPLHIECMHESIENKNWQELKSTAHKLKPKLSYIGMNSLILSVQSIEDKASEEKDLDQIHVLVSTLERDCNAAIEELKAYI